MGRSYDELNDKLQKFIGKQRLFFVATAPTSETGHVNVSPKGHDSFRVLDPKTVGYIDYVGSGVETIAHLRENQRICVLFCAFEGPPNIVRLHGRGEVFEKGTPRFEELLPSFPHVGGPPLRSIVQISLERITDSCGYTVPLFEYQGERDQLLRWGQKKTESELEDFQRRKNKMSIDGLPGLEWTTTEDPNG